MADHNNAKDAVTAWLNESEGFSLRIERLHEDAASGNDLVPWLVEAFRLGADRAAPEGQVRADRHQIARVIWDVMAWAAAQGAPEGSIPKYMEWGNSFGEVEARRAADRILALTPPPAAPTECESCVGTGTVEHLNEGPPNFGFQPCPDRAAPTALMESAFYWVNNPSAWDTFDQGASDIIEGLVNHLRALASREAPPAAQEPVAWRVFNIMQQGVPTYAKVKGNSLPDEALYPASRKEHAMEYAKIMRGEYQPLYAAPPHACQQEAVAEADLAAARAEIERLTKERDLSKELLRSCIQGNNVLRKKAQKAIAERDEERSMLADAERDMRQRAAEVCDRNDQVSGWVSRDAILALPLKHADREGGADD